MSDIAKHIRIFKTNIDDDFVTKRTAAIKVVEDAFKKPNTVDYPFQLASALIEGTSDPKKLAPEITEIVSKALKKQSSAFVADGEELQILTCALIAELEYLSNAVRSKQYQLLTIDIHALTIWNCFSFYSFVSGKNKLQALVDELVKQASNLVLNVSYTSRDRHPVGKPKDITGIEDVAQVGAVVKTFMPIIASLKINAVLDREEIDLLWWLQNGWSEIGDCKFEKLNDVESALFKGIEVSTLLRRMPSTAHRNLVIRSVDSTQQYTAAELFVALTDSREKLSKFLTDKQYLIAYPSVFPLFTMLKSWTDNISGADKKRSLQEWGERALVEGTLLDMAKFLGDGK